MRKFKLAGFVVGVFLALPCGAQLARGQSFGVELHNTVMPASGGMGGTSIAAPQDLLSAINGNPASMSQFEGTQFTFGGAWADPNFHISQGVSLPPSSVSPYSATSNTPGSALGNIGVTMNFDDWGVPVTWGLAMISNAGMGTDFRAIPESNGTSSQLLNLQFTTGMSVRLTDALSLGATFSLGAAFLDAPYSGIGAMTPAYGARGAFGASYQLTSATSLGMYYQTVEQFRFEDAIRLSLPGNLYSAAFDVNMGMPDNIGLGVANRSLMDGRLLLAADLLFKQWDNANLFQSVYHNQWVLQTGAQYSRGQYRYRVGYVYAENPISPITNVTVGGVTLPDGIPGVNYLQAQLAVVNQHRISAGIGKVDVLPGVNFDVFAGGMFQASQDLGATSVSLNSWYAGAGITWRFGACSGLRTCPAGPACNW